MTRTTRKTWKLGSVLLLLTGLLGASTAAGADTAAAAAAGHGAPAPEGATASALMQPHGLQYLEVMQRFLNLMEGFAHIAEDPAAAGLAATIGAKDLLNAEGGESGAIEFFNQVLPEVRNEAIQRAIHLELADLYKKTGQRDKAIEQYRILITGAPASATAVAAPVGAPKP